MKIGLTETTNLIEKCNMMISATKTNLLKSNIIFRNNNYFYMKEQANI